jgi:hypothetical protein
MNKNKDGFRMPQVFTYPEDGPEPASQINTDPDKFSSTSHQKTRIRDVYPGSWILPVLRILYVYPGSDFFPSRIPDQNFSIPDPIPDPHQRI